MVDDQTSSLPTTTLEQADTIAAQLHQRRNIWVKVSLSDRLAYLQRCLESVLAVAPAWAAVACRAEGLDPTTPLAGEEWFVGPTATIAALRSLIITLKAQGQLKPVRLRSRNGQAIAVANDQVWGNLSCTLLVDTRTQKQLGTDFQAKPSWRKLFRVALAALRG